MTEPETPSPAPSSQAPWPTAAPTPPPVPSPGAPAATAAWAPPAPAQPPTSGAAWAPPAPPQWAPPPNAVVEQLVLNGQNEPIKYYVTPGAVPPPRRRHRGLLIGIIALVLMLCAGSVTAGLVYAGHHKSDNANPKTSSPAAAPGAASVAPTPAAPDNTTLNGILTQQSAAMISGDQAAWLAAIDPTATAAIAEYKRIFHNLRAMKVASWTQTSPAGEAPTQDRAAYEIDVTYCLITAPCTGLGATMNVTAQRVGNGVKVESITIPAADRSHSRPIPWLVANLSAAVGKRVVVAASSAEQSRLPAALRSAEQAATAADAFAHWGKPDVYVAYLADKAEAKTWFGSVVHPEQYLGMTATLGDSDLESVAFMPDAATNAGPGGLTETLQWLFGDEALSYGAGGFGDNTLGSGLSDYISMYGHANWVGGTVIGARSYVHSGKWNKNVYLTSELQSTSNTTRWGAEGIGYLTIRHLVSRFGLTKTLEFWGDVEREDFSLDNASSLVFGLSWKSVNADCVNYIEHSV